MLLSLIFSCHRTVSPPPQAHADSCGLSIESLAGTEWLYLMALPDGSSSPSPQTRLTFRREAGELTALYSAGSLSDLYRYTCRGDGEELLCETPADLTAWCRALLAGTGTCTDEQLRPLAPSAAPAALAAVRAQAEAEQAAQVTDEQKSRWRLTNNNLGNKLQLRMAVRVDDARCRLVVTDLYRTAYNGQVIEDSNPVGTNPFVKNEAGELLWEHCDDVRGLLDGPTPDALAATPRASLHEVGEEVHYEYRSDTLRTPTEGCTYRYDLWWNARPYRRDLTPATAIIDEATTLQWRFSRTYDSPTPPGQAEVMTMVMEEQCPEAEPVEVVACSAVLARSVPQP